MVRRHWGGSVSMRPTWSLTPCDHLFADERLGQTILYTPAFWFMSAAAAAAVAPTRAAAAVVV